MKTIEKVTPAPRPAKAETDKALLVLAKETWVRDLELLAEDGGAEVETFFLED